MRDRLIKNIQYFYNENRSSLESSVASIIKTINSHKIEKVCDNTKKNIALFCTDLPRPDNDSGSRRLCEIIDILIDLECKVTIFTHNDWSDEDIKYSKIMSDKNVTVLVADHGNNKYPNSLFLELQEYQKVHFDVIYYYGYEMHNAYGEFIFFSSPQSKVIVDSIDVHWSRFERCKEACKDKVQKDKNLEILSYSKCDVVFAVTENDKFKIHKECNNANVKILSNIHSKQYSKNKALSNRCMFVGGEGHTPNIDAIKTCINIVNKYNENHEKKIFLDIVGKQTNADLLNLTSDYIVFHGKVSDYALKILYDNCQFVLCPLSWGSGIKGKICEAICHGVLVVTSNIGNEGINLKNTENGFVCETEEEYIRSIEKCLSIDSREYQRTRESAYNQLCKLVSRENAKNTLSATISHKPVVLSVLTHNNQYLLNKCLQSIITNTHYPDYKIHITSDCCRDDTKKIVMEYQKKYPGLIEYTYNHKNLYYILSHNNVIKKYPDRDVVLMNEDIEIITNYWLSILYNAAYSSDNIACSGGKSLSTDGKISEAGAQLYNSGQGHNLGRQHDRYDIDFNYERYVGYVSGCVMYMKRSAIDKLGILDPSYHPCYYEDSDWQYNAHINGYKTIYTPFCEFIHREGSSCGVDMESGLKKYMNINRDKFIEKYKGCDIEEHNS